MPEKDRILAVLRNIFACFDQSNSGTIPIDEIAPILRYMGQFPPEGELVEVIHKQLLDEAQSRDIPIPMVEKLILKLVTDREYEPDFPDTLLEAFKAIDVENQGYVSIDRATEVLTAGASGLKERELSEFLRFARDDKETTRIYYEDYINKLVKINSRHTRRLLN